MNAFKIIVASFYVYLYIIHSQVLDYTCMYILILSYKNTTKTQIFVASKVHYIFKEYSFYLKSMCHVVQVSILSCNKYLFITGTKCENTRAFITADIRKDIFNGRTHLFNFRFDNSRCVYFFLPMKDISLVVLIKSAGQRKTY